MIVDLDPATGFETGIDREGGVRLDTDGHDDEVGGHLAAVLQQNALDPMFAGDLGRVGLRENREAAAFEFVLEQASGGAQSRPCREG